MYCIYNNNCRKLRRTTNGTLLINLSVSLLGVYVFFITGGHIREYGNTDAVDIVCGFNSALIHYFMLVYFGWTAAEALNLFIRSVVVFVNIGKYTLKAGLVVWCKLKTPPPLSLPPSSVFPFSLLKHVFTS